MSGIRALAVVAAALMAIVGPAAGGDLDFPATEDEIIRALTPKDRPATRSLVPAPAAAGNPDAVADRPLRFRGLGGVVDVETAPKAGALVRFDVDSATVRPESFPLLGEFGKALGGALAEAVVMVAGHTDSQGSEAYNRNLAERRARAVRDHLVDRHGIAADRLVVKAYGESRPIADNGTAEGRALNRRVEFIRLR